MEVVLGGTYLFIGGYVSSQFDFAECSFTNGLSQQVFADSFLLRDLFNIAFISTFLFKRV
jgi:hypothetical protein